MVSTVTSTATSPATESPINENATRSKSVRRMFWGWDLHTWEHWLLGLLVLAAIGAVGVAVATYAVVKLQRFEASQAKSELEAYKADAATQTAQANQRAAEANARAEQANLELQRLRLPRSLNDDTLVAHLAGKPRWPVIEILYVDEMDSSFLATRIMTALHAAGWGTPMPRVIRGTNPNWEHGAALAEVMPATSTWGAQSVGVSVVSSSEPDPDGRSPAVTLWTAIAKAISEGQTNLGRDNSMPPHTIRIVVAPRR